MSQQSCSRRVYEQGGFTLTDLALEAGMAKGAHNVGVVQVLGDSHLHGGPIRGTLDVLILLRCYDLQTCHHHKASVKASDFVRHSTDSYVGLQAFSGRSCSSNLCCAVL